MTQFLTWWIAKLWMSGCYLHAWVMDMNLTLLSVKRYTADSALSNRCWCDNGKDGFFSQWQSTSHQLRSIDFYTRQCLTMTETHHFTSRTAGSRTHYEARCVFTHTFTKLQSFALWVRIFFFLLCQCHIDGRCGHVMTQFILAVTEIVDSGQRFRLHNWALYQIRKHIDTIASAYYGLKSIRGPQR